MKIILTAIIFSIVFPFAYAQNTAAIEAKIPERPPFVNILYIIDGIPTDDKSFAELDPEDIISIRILKNHQFEFSCLPPRDFIIINTKNGLTKREARKLKRNQKNKDKAELVKLKQ